MGYQGNGSIITTDLGGLTISFVGDTYQLNLRTASAMPLLEHNVTQNESLYVTPGTRPHPIVLDWDEEELPAEIQSVPGGFDVIMSVFLIHHKVLS